MKKLSALCLVLLIADLCPLISARAQAPQLINYQGRLLNGTNLVNGNVGLSLRLFDAAAAGTLLYEDSNTVTVVDGLYSTFIGDNPTNSSFLSALTNAAVWVEVAVNGVALSPRERLSSVAYSLNTRGILVDAKSNLTMFPDENSIADSFFGHATISGGFGNSIMSNSRSAFLGGGDGNSIQPFAGWSVLGGGSSNSIQRNANFSFLGGGFQNSIQTNAVFTFLGGGYSNSVTATYGTVPGGYQNNAGYLSFAAGRRAKATNDGSFVWADSTDADFGTTSSNQLLIRASGGVGIGTNITSGAALNVAGAIKAASFSGDGSALTGISVSGAAIVDGTISNADLSASVLTNISARLASNVWTTADATTNSVRRTGDGMSGVLTNLVGFTGNGAGLTNLSVSGAAIVDGTISNADLSASVLTNISARADSNLVWSTFAAVTGLTAETTARIGGDASLSNTVASLATNVAARLASNVWATANATTNYVRRTGDSMSGALTNLVGFAGNGTGLTNVYSVRAISVNSNNNIFVHNPAENSVDPSADHSTLGGGYYNGIEPNAIGAFLGGGSINGILSNATYSFLGGGYGNSIQQGATYSFLGGGYINSIEPNAIGAFLGGGSINGILSNATYSFLGGGYGNGIQTGATYSFLGGGQQSSIQQGATHSFLGGGYGNSIQQGATHSFLGGGFGNSIQSNATYSFLGGGYGNGIAPNASVAFLGGGQDNSVSGSYGMVPGGYGNSAGYLSFAAGRRAKATHDGSFVWADSTDADFGTTSSNQFLIRASGGVGIGTAAPTAPLTVQAATNRAGENTATFYAPAIGFNKSHIHYGTNGDWFIRSASGSGNVILQDTGGRVGIGTSSPTGLLHVAGNAYAQAWLTTSDRNAKQDIAPVDAAAILEKIIALPVASWSFKTEPDVKHIGPMAQDFRAAFGLGPNDTSIATVDADGVALAAIQALNRKLDAVMKENTELRARLDALEGK